MHAALQEVKTRLINYLATSPLPGASVEHDYGDRSEAIGVRLECGSGICLRVKQIVQRGDMYPDSAPLLTPLTFNVRQIVISDPIALSRFSETLSWARAAWMNCREESDG